MVAARHGGGVRAAMLEHMSLIAWICIALGAISLVATIAYARHLRRHTEAPRGPFRIGIPAGITGALLAYPLLDLLDRS